MTQFDEHMRAVLFYYPSSVVSLWVWTGCFWNGSWAWMQGFVSVFGVYASRISECSLTLPEGSPSMEIWRSEHMQARGFRVWGLAAGFGFGYVRPADVGTISVWGVGPF